MDSNTLALDQSIQSYIHGDAAKHLIDLLIETLKADRSDINEAFATRNWQHLFFLTERLLGAIYYFNTPKLQIALKMATGAAFKQDCPQLLMDKLNQEIDAVLQLAR
jgi:hypothetical protein